MSRFTAGDHVCVAFDGGDELLEAVADSARCALENGEKAVCYTAQFLPLAVEATLEASDLRMRAGLDSGQVVIASVHDAHLVTGQFDPERTITAWREKIGQARQDGFAGIRVIADMSWAADIAPARVNRLAWYEAQLNRVFAAGFATVLCMYDRRLFTQAQLNAYAPAHTASARAESGVLRQLRIAHTTDPRGLRLSGEADLATAVAVEAVLAGLPEDVPGDGPLVIDLSGLAFADVGTITSLVRTARRNPGMRFASPTPLVGRMLEMVGEFEGVRVNL